MKIKLVFDDWQRNGDPVNPLIDSDLFEGDFYYGDKFNGNIELTKEQRLELLASITAGYTPVFWVDIDSKL